MKDTIQRRCDLLIENWSLIHKKHWLENSLIVTIAASEFAGNDKTVDVDLLNDCIKLLKKKQGIFSEFRGNNELVVSSKMALSGNPEGYIDNVIEVYKKLQEGKFWSSNYRALAAMVIADAGKINEAEEIIEKTNELLKGMKKDHPFLTSDEDTCFAVLLAMTGRSVEDILAELEETYQEVKKNFAFHDNAAYSLSQVLTAYEGNAQQKRDRALEIFDAFKEAGAKYGKEYELASLGTLANLDVDKDVLVTDIVEVADYLKGKKGFGMLDMGKQTRLMFGTMMVSQEYASDDTGVNTSVVSGAIGRVIAEQTAMLIAVIAASSSSAAASTTH